MPVEEACSDVCTVDVLEIVAVGGAGCEQTENCVSCMTKFIGILYFLLHTLVSVACAVLERMAFDSAISVKSDIVNSGNITVHFNNRSSSSPGETGNSSTISTTLNEVVSSISARSDIAQNDSIAVYFNNHSSTVPSETAYRSTILNEVEYDWRDLAGAIDSDTAIALWSAGIWVLTVVVIPIQFWLFAHFLIGAQKCCCERNPFCCCFTKHDSNSNHYEFCMDVNLYLFSMFEDLVHIGITVGRLYFVMSAVANASAYQQTNQVNAAMYIEIAADGFNFLFKWKYFYCGCSCNCILHFLKLLQFILSASTLYFAVICILVLTVDYTIFTVDSLALSYAGAMIVIFGSTLILSCICWCCCDK